MSPVCEGHGYHRWPRVPDKVEVDLDMLHALLLNGVGGEVDNADVVVVGDSALCQRSMKLLK
jgi:hypothetical protein